MRVVYHIFCKYWCTNYKRRNLPNCELKIKIRTLFSSVEVQIKLPLLIKQKGVSFFLNVSCWYRNEMSRIIVWSTYLRSMVDSFVSETNSLVYCVQSLLWPYVRLSLVNNFCGHLAIEVVGCSKDNYISLIIWFLKVQF